MNILPTLKTDSQFAHGLLTLLRTRAHELPEHARSTLMDLAINPNVINTKQSRAAVKAALSFKPALVRHVSETDMVALSMLPIWIWASEENGLASCDLKKHALIWGASLVEPRETALNMCLRALHSTHALRDELGVEDLRALSNFWQDKISKTVWGKAYTFNSRWFATWTNICVQLGLLHEHVGALNIAEDGPKGLRPWSQRWAQQVGKCLHDMADVQQKDFLLSLASSDLSNVYKLRAFKHARPAVWLLPEIHSAVMLILPKSEVARWQQLPWSRAAPLDSSNTSAVSADQASSDNRALAMLYCPKNASVLDVLIAENMWADRKTVELAMGGFSKKFRAPEEMTDIGHLFDMP